ncbi:MAG: beta-glucosidase [Mucilaginibacter polytrichastri]|nr:beta-glucosidase [Mucilaginibacter polytrichastri]
MNFKSTCWIILGLIFFQTSSAQKNISQKKLSDAALLDSVQKRTFRYFWDAAEPNSGLACERVHEDGVYPENDQRIVTTGGSGFGVMGILVGIERKFITRQQGLKRFEKIVSFLEKADRFHGAYPHWINGETGKVKPFGQKDNGGDLVETSFLFQGLLCVRQYFQTGNTQEKQLAARIDKLWKEIDFDWYRKGGQDVLYWHWSPSYAWDMNFAVTGYNECLIMYVLGASSPTHGIPAEVYHKGWAKNGAIRKPHKVYGFQIDLDHNGAPNSVGPLFWAHYSYLGLNPMGLKDRYADYGRENTNHTKAIRAYCLANPKKFKGYGADSWGLTASYSVKGYAAHSPQEDFGVISPTAAISSYPYTPKESMQVIRHLYEDLGDKVFGRYGFIDGFSETDNWFQKRYLAIDQGPEIVMIENGRSGLLWKLFMSCPEVKSGLKKLGFTSQPPAKK